MSSGSRGRGGKFSKPKRGGMYTRKTRIVVGERPLTLAKGARHFSQRTNEDGEQINMWAPRSKKEESSSEEDSEEESSEEESSEDDGPQAQSSMTREERKEQQRKKKAAAIKKAKGIPAVGDMPSSSEESSEDDADMPANPNHTAKARSLAANPKTAEPEDAPTPAPTKGKAKDVSQLSRREREALQAQQAKERYQKMHLEGKTDEARADMERLKLIREKRATEAARREAEAAEKAEEAKAKLQETKGGSGMTREEKMREAAMGTKSGGKKKK